MKLKKSLIFLSACFILFSTSCRKQSNSTPRFESQQVKTHALLTDRDPSNEENPYDDAGYYHNLGLESVKAYLINNPNASADDIAGHVEGWVYTTFSEVIDMPKTDEVESIVSDYEYPDATVETHLASIAGIINNIYSYSTYEDFKADILDIEETVSSSASLSNNQKETILGAASVARYSASYWWEHSSGSAATDKRKDVINADVDGFGEGVRWGSPLAGAVLSSGARALQDFVYWWNH